MKAILTLNQSAALLQATPRILQAELDPWPDEITRFRPAPDEWCANAVIGHLIEIDKRGFAAHIQGIVISDRPYTSQAWDQAQVARDRQDDKKSLSVLLAEFAALRQEKIELILTLQPEQLAQSGYFPEVGELSVSDLLQVWIHHDRNHIKQLMSNLQRFIRQHAEFFSKF